MSAEKLITENLELWTSAVKAKKTQGRGSNSKRELYGIKKLRELILELAVRGKLVPQDPNDEPASVLLERIAAAKEQLIKEKKLKKTKQLPIITDKDQPFKLPNGWEFARLGNNVSIIRGITFPASEKKSEPDVGRIACLRTANVQDSTEWDDLLYVDKGFVKREEQIVRPKDILMSMANSRELVGKVSYVPSIPVERCSFGGFLSVIRSHVIEPFYLMSVLRSPSIKNKLIDSASQTTNLANISLDKLNPLIIPVPPITEQVKITTKVDQLMALCDQLEQQTEASLGAHQQLVDTLLATLTSAQDAEELKQNWARLSEHFDTLITTDYAVEQLKQTILQLAVMGKLVPQDPNDEPASVLLERIAAEKAQLVKEKKIKKQKLLPEIGDEEISFTLPNGWSWTRLQQVITLLGDGLHGTPCYDETGSYFFINGNNLNSGAIKIKPETKRVNKEEYKKYKKPLNERTILVSINGSLGKVAFYDGEPIVLGKSACYFNLGHKLSKPFFKRIIESPYFKEYALINATGSTIKNLGLKAVNRFPIALPPIAEQLKIVKKVDELMILCDQLKSTLNKAQSKQLLMADTILIGALS
ncbi:restriction endonuclease subunit S [Microbulbifer sp. TRSA007]|uniref:restriction endonuclease subunit S n=1 Tax=Microbulbifer sp. TRSA007 TaxID=3243384 RepID=UPI0040390E09